LGGVEAFTTSVVITAPGIRRQEEANEMILFLGASNQVPIAKPVAIRCKEGTDSSNPPNT